MSPETITAISTASAGLGAGLGWFLRNARNGHAKFTKQQHDEICSLRIEPIEKQLEDGKLHFEHIHTKLDKLLELVYDQKKEVKWVPGMPDRRKQQR